MSLFLLSTVNTSSQIASFVQAKQSIHVPRGAYKQTCDPVSTD